MKLLVVYMVYKASSAAFLVKCLSAEESNNNRRCKAENQALYTL
jgi:hypothetical protein